MLIRFEVKMFCDMAFYLLKNDLNVPSKSNKQKSVEKIFCWRLEGP
jgi:hypothetical protein